jgi:hypothetical protein
LDDPNIWLFGYSDGQNNQIFGYSVIRVIRRKPNLAIIAQNRLRALPKNGISLRESQYFWRKFWQKPEIPNFCEVSLMAALYC